LKNKVLTNKKKIIMVPLQEEIKKQDLVDQLTWDVSVNANDVNVEVADNTVRLKGTVPNYTAKLAAERDAYAVSGVQDVENLLNVEFPPSITVPTDSEIENNIKKMLFLNAKIISVDINVSVSSGLVTLSGYVDTLWEKYEAEEIANSATGVIDVINELEVQLTKDFIDLDIENDIIAAFRRSALIDHENINVSLSNGIAHLTGNANSFVEKSEAYKIALFTKDVVDVIDDIVIK